MVRKKKREGGKSRTASSSEEVSRKYVLSLDGAYYAEALARFESASKAEPEYDRWADEINNGQSEIAEREAKYENPIDAYDEVESLVIKLDRDWTSFDRVSRSFVQSAASVHILCFACLEAHINMRAEETLSGKAFAEFDKLSTTGKWLFYPRLISVGNFDPGAEPFQGIQTLATKRNALLHYKTRVNYRRYGYEVPGFVDELGLRASILKKSLKSVSEMVKKLASMEKREVPGWITDDWWGIFDMEVPKS